MRADRDEMFLSIAGIVAARSTCTRASVGAVIVQDRRIVSMGYNGAPPGMPHCTDVGCETEWVNVKGGAGRYEIEGCVRAIHAEANAIAWAARAGVAVKGATMYGTHGPCLNCARLILAAGIESFHFNTYYRLQAQGLLLLDQGLVQLHDHT